MSTVRLTRRWRAVRAAAVAGSLISIGLGTGAATASATQPGPREIATIPVPQPGPLLQDHVLVAGATGFLHQEEGRPGYLWTDYASGATKTLTLPATAVGAVFSSAGGDRFAFQSHLQDPLTVIDPVASTTTSYPNPVFGAVVGFSADGQHVLYANGRLLPQLRQLNPNGTVTSQTVTGLPATALGVVGASNVSADGTAGIIAYTVLQGTTRVPGYALLNLTTGQATPLTGLDQLPLTQVTVSGGYVVALARESSAPADRVLLMPVSAVLDGSAATTAWRGVQLSGGQGAIQSAQVLGSQVVLDLAGTATLTPQAATVPLSSVVATGGAPVTATPLVAQLSGAIGSNGDPGSFVPSADGLLAVGGSADDNRAVQRITAQADGSPSVSVLLDLKRPASAYRTVGLTMAYGMVREYSTATQVGLATGISGTAHPLAAASTTGWQLGLARTEPVALDANAQSCEGATDCLRSVDGNWYGALYLADKGSTTEIHSIRDAYSSTINPVVLPATGAELVDTDPSDAVVNAVSTQTQYLVDLGQNKIVRTGPITGAALWYGTYWHATGPGVVTASDEASGAAQRTVSTGSACEPSELQVAQHWLYWSCGASGPAGVVNLTTGGRITVPSGTASLGDGFLVQHDAASGALVMTDFHSGQAAAPVVLGTAVAGPGDDRNVTWAVDRQSGDVAYDAADGLIHVTTTGVPASDPTVRTQPSSGWVAPRDQAPYNNTWWLAGTSSRPLASWQLTITRRATGQVVATVSGGATPAQFNASWNGRLTSGAIAPSGAYTWQLTATPADAAAGQPAQVGQGVVDVSAGQPEFRTYDQTGHPGLLTVNGGHAQWYQADDSGRLVDQGYAEDWNLGSASWQFNTVLPFGDANGDGNNDLLARDGAGRLHLYYGVGAGNFNPAYGVRSVLIGSGWNTYDTLLSPGDVNHDGHDDLLARDRTGRLWFYPGTGHGSFGGRVLVGAGWNAYTKIITVGDVNGDGAPDLVAVDGSGQLWRYFGNGHGGFGPRARVGTGWGGYTSLIGIGDLRQDGHNDLLARDRSGVLWRYEFDAQGGLSSRVRIGGGWNQYTLF